MSKTANDQDTLCNAVETQHAKSIHTTAPPQPADELLHELRVYQIELQIQNETLREAQLALEESRDRYMDLYDFAPVTYLTLNNAGFITEINLTGTKLLGVERSNLINHRFASFVSPDDGDRWHLYFVNILRAQFQTPCEIKLRHNNRAPSYVRLDCLLTNDSSTPSIRIVITDISERRAAQIQLDELLMFNKKILQESPSGIAVFKADGRCVMSNEVYAKTVGATVDEILLQNFRKNESWQHYGLLDIANRVLTEKLTVKQDINGITSFGKKVTLECIFTCVEISGVRHLVFITNDVSERLEAARILTAANRHLAQNELAKTRFLAAAGHDLRQPLAAANMFIFALNSTATSPEQTQLIQRINYSMDTFKGLLDALLDVSKLDSNSLTPKLASVNVFELISWVEQNFSNLAIDKQLGLKLFFPMNEQLIVHSDIGLLKSVLMNLVSNAIKFTTTGAVMVSTRRRGSDVLFQVWDTGIGIPARDLNNIFDEFYQVDNPQRDRTSGLGLGLSIVKRTLALLGSEISCHSRIGRGTVFEFKLPIASSDDLASQAKPAIELPERRDYALLAKGMQFIVVEDDALVSQATKSLLEVLGAKVDCFHSAELALLHADIERADYYLVDYMLGGMLSGIEFLNKLRLTSSKPIKAVLMTGDTSSNFIRESTDFEWPIQYKPVNVPDLLSSLRAQQDFATT